MRWFFEVVLYVVRHSDVGVGLCETLLALVGSLGGLLALLTKIPELSIHSLGLSGESSVPMHLGSERHVPQLVDCLTDYRRK